MSTHSIKGLRAEFREAGKFHTPPELAKFLHDLIPDADQVRDVYDPTCGAGNLLAIFPDSTPKFGQDIDEAALRDARERLSNFTGHLGDILEDPASLTGPGRPSDGAPTSARHASGVRREGGRWHD